MEKFSIWNMLLSAGIAAKSMSSTISFLSQSRRRSCRYAITPVMPNSGSHPATLAHLQLDSGVKVGIAGISAGKKKANKVRKYRCGRS